MTDRERLIELMAQSNEVHSVDNGEFIETTVNWGEIADHLLANGVIVLPCKVGDTVYVVDYTRLGKMIFECRIDEISHYSYGTFYYLNWGLHIPRFRACKEDSFGKTVFLTKEEAEKALKERYKKGGAADV